MAKQKNLNKYSKRQYLLQQKNQIENELLETVELYKDDFESYLKEYESAMIEHEFAEKTREKYLRNARWFVDTYTSEDKPLVKTDVIRFKSDIQNAYNKTSTINNYITTINRFLYFCDLDALKVSKVKEQSVNVLKERLYNHEVTRIRNRAKKVDMQLYFVIRIMSEMGLRVAERKFITVENIASRHLEIQVNNKGKWRTVPIPQELARDLRSYAKLQNIETGQILDISYDSIYERLKKVASHCKINRAKVRPHAFRHYFGFRFIDNNGEATVTQLADIMGHGSAETTRIYTRGTSQDYRKAIEKMI